MLRSCQAEGCNTLTLGELCIEHEPEAEPRRFPRGRPYRLKDREVTGELRRIDETWSLAGQESSRLSLPS
ncbi:MAG TPA: hypothetical protein VGL76_02730 [Gaiellaceae bacterium]|jgi:hypothetical protein